MSIKLRIWFLAVVSLAAVVLAGCSSGGGPPMAALSVVSGKAIHEFSGGVCCNPPTYSPLVSALINFTDLAGQTVQTRADSSGNYRVRLPAGTYSAALADRAGEPSYSSVDPAQIVVPPNSSMAVDITFQLLAP